jgi:hypothetical protein
MWDRPIPFPYFCFPDSIVPGEGERCNAIEAALMAREAEIIEGLKAAGYTLWLAAPIDYGADGVPNAYADVRPHFSNFDGVYAGVGANSSVQVDDVPAAVAATVANLAATVGPDMPVVLTLNGPPITSQTGSDFCEADICPSDFAGMYNLAEAALTTAMDAFTPEQLRGFGVSMFEGSHFDIRQPYETFPGFSLNRVGETGFNNPILNVYLAQ